MPPRGKGNAHPILPQIRLDARRLRGRFNRFGFVRGAIVLQSPGIHFARPARLHTYDDIAVPRPRMFPVKFTRPRRRVGMRMIPADQFQFFFTRRFLRQLYISRGYFKPVSWGIVPPIRQRQQVQYFARTISIAAQNRATTFVRIRLHPVRLNFRRKIISEFQNVPAHSSLQNLSLKYLSAESGNTVTITARSPGGNRRATSIDAHNAPAALTPTSNPSSRAKRFASCCASSVRTAMSSSASAGS